MKRFKYVLIYFVCFFMMCGKTLAECQSDMSTLKSLADKVEISYEINNEIYNNTGKKDTYMITVKNLNNKIYVYEMSSGRYFAYLDDIDPIVNQTFADDFKGGYKTFNIYAYDCTTKLRTIEIKLDRFNEYSLDPLCKGISGEDLAICNTWYDYEVDRDTFVERVEQYKENKKENNNKPDNNNPSNEDKSFFGDILSFLGKYYPYIIGGLVIVTVIIIIVVKRKRGRLE